MEGIGVRSCSATLSTTVALTYSTGGLLTKFTDARGHATVMSYDALGHLLSA